MKKRGFAWIIIAFSLMGKIAYAEPSSFNDVHFHLTNYIQEGLRLKNFVKIMNESGVNRAAVFGIPLQQKWDYFVSTNRKPDYYLESDASLYYYSFVDSIIAYEFNSLPTVDQKRIDPMITGFNPTDMYAADHIRRVLQIHPGIFSGIGEFSIHKEFVSSKITGHTASLKNKALDRVMDFANEAGLVCLVHVDINTLRNDKRLEPSHFKDIKKVFERHKDLTIIWAHTGLGRFVTPTTNHVDLLEELITNPDLKNLHFDISWDEIAKYIVKDEKTTQLWANLINKYPTRFLFGTDSVSPANTKQYLKTYDDYKNLWNKLSPEANNLVKLENYERLFDLAKIKVRKWEQQNKLD